MKDKVLCPYCGSEMGFGTEHKFPNQLYFIARYICTECGATSPRQVHTDHERAKELTKEAALKRFKPLQQPLPWAKVIELGKHPHTILWIEASTHESHYVSEGWYEPFTQGEVDKNGVFRFTDNIKFYRPGRDNPHEFLSTLYGVEFRCWATKPTEEERKAAEWKKT